MIFSLHSTGLTAGVTAVSLQLVLLDVCAELKDEAFLHVLSLRSSWNATQQLYDDLKHEI